MVALEAFVTFYPQSKKRQMTSWKNQAVIQPNLQWVFAGIGNQETSHASEIHEGLPTDDVIIMAALFSVFRLVEILF
jgi:hypothetical protein